MNKKDTFAQHIDQIIEEITTLQAFGKRINGLEQRQKYQHHADILLNSFHALNEQVADFQKAINALPDPAPIEEILWAQATGFMPNLAFLELDTTGLGEKDELIRFTLLGADGVKLIDLFIQPQTQTLTQEVSEINGILPSQLEQAPSLPSVWHKIQMSLYGLYVISYNQEWDRKILERAARLHNLEPLNFIGDCLHKHAMSYYHREYYLTLEKLAARMGKPMPAKPNQTSLDRCAAQHMILLAMSQAITGVPEPEAEQKPASTSSSTGDDFDPFLDGSDDLP